jgi:hypothetical protein
MVETITAIEAWTLARALGNCPFITPRNLISPDVMELVRQINGIQTFQNKQFILSQKIPGDAFQQVTNADTEAPMPGTIPPTWNNRQWRIIPAADLAKLPKATWLIPDILPEMGLSVLYGAPGSYKSFVALDWSLRVAQKRPVVYTIYEGLTGYWQRIKAWSEHFSGGYDNLQMCIGDLAVMDLNQLNEFVEELHKYKPALVVIDTLARAMTGSDENSSRDMGLFVAGCERIRRELSAAVLIVHHSNKGGVHERGSIALRGAADVMIKQTLDDDIIVTECDKMKDAEPFQTCYSMAIAKRIYIDDLPYDVPVLGDASGVKRDASRITRNQLKVMEVLNLAVFASHGATAAEIGESLSELGRGSINRILSRLMEVGLVCQPMKRDPYKLTTDGLTHLNRMNPTTRTSEAINTADTGEIASQTNQPAKVKQRVMFPKQLNDFGHYDHE